MVLEGLYGIRPVLHFLHSGVAALMRVSPESLIPHHTYIINDK